MSGLAVPGADVVLLDAVGRTHAATSTDASGRFVLSAARGEYQLRVAHVGYQETTQQIVLLDSLRITIGMTPQPIVLDSLGATARARVPALDRVGFYQRQNLGTGYFLDRAEVERRAADGRVFEALRGIPGVRVVPVLDGTGEYDIRMRDSRCLPSIIVDWQVVRRGGTGSSDREVLPHPDQIEAIEVYPGPAGIPPRARSGTGPCGAILIWTKH